MLDVALRDETHGKQSVTSWFRELANDFGGKTGYRVEDLRALTARLSGVPDGTAASLFEHAFLGSGKLDLDALFGRLGIDCTEAGDCKLKPIDSAELTMRQKAFSATP